MKSRWKHAFLLGAVVLCGCAMTAVYHDWWWSYCASFAAMCGLFVWAMNLKFKEETKDWDAERSRNS